MDVVQTERNLARMTRTKRQQEELGDNDIMSINSNQAPELLQENDDDRDSEKKCSTTTTTRVYKRKPSSSGETKKGSTSRSGGGVTSSRPSIFACFRRRDNNNYHHNSPKNGGGGGRPRRAFSAPAATGSRRRRRRLLEDHYRVDPERRVVLPGVPQYDPNLARDLHDFFNLIVLIPVVALNVMNWNWDLILRLYVFSNFNNNNNSNNNSHNSGNPTVVPNGTTLADAWTGEWFDLFFLVTALYFAFDLAWIIMIPNCVRSAATIIQHHVATLLYIMIPYNCPDLRWCMGACMIVEINTWFLIARRVFNKQGFPPWIIDLSFVSIRVKLISVFFYITWVVTRCIIYPYLLPLFYKSWMDHSKQMGTLWNVVALAVPLHACFCLLNLKWSYDLLMSKIRFWTRKSKHQVYKIDKGL